jgi:hypothetical protein
LMPRIRLPVIREPKEGTRTAFTGEEVPAEDTEPFIVGEGETAGDTDLICGHCGLLLAQSIHRDTLMSIVLRCPRCGAYNNVV